MEKAVQGSCLLRIWHSSHSCSVAGLKCGSTDSVSCVKTCSERKLHHTIIHDLQIRHGNIEANCVEVSFGKFGRSTQPFIDPK